MKKTNWCTKEEMKKILTSVDVKGENVKAGIPVMYDDNYLYVNDKVEHTLVIGSSGSGKTQTTILPMLKLAMKAGESIVLNDVKGDIYRMTAKELERNGYKTVVLDIENPNLGNSWNPFALPYKLYKEGMVDKAMELLENIIYYLFNDPKDKSANIDPFWTNTSIDYLTGMSLYLFSVAKEEEINLKSIYELAITVSGSEEKVIKEFLSKVDKTSSVYFNIYGTLSTPVETRSGIIATLNSKIRPYVSRDSLSNMMGATDFDIENIGNEKMAIFIVSGNTEYSDNLIPLFVNQVIDCVDIYGKREKKINVLLDEFDSLLPIKNFSKLISYAKGLNIRFIAVIKSYVSLMNTYGKDGLEIIKMCFGNVIYLLSNDIYTLEEVSNLCGNVTDEKGNSTPLISTQELKMMDNFEAIIVMPRTMPFRTHLLPDYKIDWGFEDSLVDIPKRKENVINVYDCTK